MALPVSIARTRVKRERLPRLIVQLLISYVVIVSLGVGFFVIPAQNVVQLLRSQSRADQTAAVQRYGRSADSVLSLFANIATAFLSDGDMFSLAHDHAADRNRAYYSIMAQLTQYNQLYGDIFDQIYVYDSSADTLLSLTGLAPSEAYYAAKLTAGLSREGYAKMLSQTVPGKPLLFQEGRQVYVTHTLAFNYPDARYIAVVFTLPLANFYGISAKTEQMPAQYGIYLADTDTLLGAAEDADLPVAALAQAERGTSGIQVETLDGQGDLFLLESARSGRYFYFLMPHSLYNQQTASFSRFLVFSLIGFVAVSVLIILLSVWQQYRPLMRLLSEIDSDAVQSLSTRDYRRILDYLSSLRKERDDYRTLMADQNPRLRQLLLTSLVTGSGMAPREVDTSLRLLDIAFPHPFYAVVVVDILDDAELFFEKQAEPERYSLFLAENVLGDLLGEEIARAFFVLDGALVCLLNLRVEDSPQGALAQLQDKLLFASDFLLRELNLMCRFAASSLHSGMEGLVDAYLEALECTNGLHPQDQFVFVYDLLSAAAPQAYVYLQPYGGEEARRLTAALRGGNGEKACAVVRQLFGAAQARADLHPLAYKSMCRSMACGFVDVLTELDIADGALERRLWALLDVDTRTLSTKAMEERVLALCEEVTACVKAADAGRKVRLMADINAYVQAHYADPNLGVTGIAEVFALSVSSLSGFYGRNSDTGLCKYINRVRVQNACRLLLEDAGMPLEEVAARVGYTNTRTFSRVFSAEMQCSPGKYRTQGGRG